MTVIKIQPLFRAHGYDAVSMADVTTTLLIKPPSFYTAFGNKIGFYKRVLNRHVQAEAIPLDDILRPGKPASEYLTDLPKKTVRRYTADPYALGCLILEDTHSNDPQTRKVA